MAHVHGEKMVEAAKNVAAVAPHPRNMEGAMGHMMGSGMQGMMMKGMGGAMHSGMEGMAGEGARMGAGMGHAMGAGMAGMSGMTSGMGHMMGAGMEGMRGMMMTPHAASGAAATLVATTRHSLLRRLITHPVVLFGLGLAAGYLIHKYRADILRTGSEVAD